MYGWIPFSRPMYICLTVNPACSGQQGLKNERPGGETVPKDGEDGPYCVYVERPSDNKTSGA